MQLPHNPSGQSVGLSFDIPDLLMLLAWAEFHDLRMIVELDTVIEGQAFEETVALCHPVSLYRLWVLWRSRDGIRVRPSMGREMMFDVVADALDLLIPAMD